MWKSVIWDRPDEEDEQGAPNPRFDEWVEAVMNEPWFVALRDLVRWTGTWTGTEEELMKELRLRVNGEVWESEDFPSAPQELMEYYENIFFASSEVSLGDEGVSLLDYREFKKKDLEDYDVPGWGPEAPILLSQVWAGGRPSYEQALYTLLDKYRSPLPLAVLGFTNGRKFTKKTRSWSGSTTELARALLGYYPWPDCHWPTYCPALPPSPEDPDGRDAQQLFDETYELLTNLLDPSDFRRFHGLMKTCAYIVRDVGIKVSWEKVPWMVTDPEEGASKSTKRTRWTIEAPRWCS